MDVTMIALVLAAVVGGNCLSLWLVSAVGPVRGLAVVLTRRVRDQLNAVGHRHLSPGFCCGLAPMLCAALAAVALGCGASYLLECCGCGADCQCCEACCCTDCGDDSCGDDYCEPYAPR